MNQTFQCTKIKDGLYIGNIVAAHDYQFLISNKFSFVVNCTSQIPNVFQSYENIQYLKFKLIANKPHKLWDQSFKKLNKLEKFIEQAQEQSLCVLIHSFHGQNRSLVFVTAYLMKKFKWRLKKCLEFLKSKQIFIGLSGHYITQLQILQNILSKNDVLTLSWIPPYINIQEQIMCKTFLNSLQYIKMNQIMYNKDQKKLIEQKKQRKKKQKRIVWFDRLQKKIKKESQIKKDIKQFQQFQYEQLSKISQNQKIKQVTSTHLLSHMRKKQSVSNKQLIQQIINNKQKDQKEKEKDKNIYQLTINNFISPNFNIINKSQPLLKKTKNEEKQIKIQRQKSQKSYKNENDKSENIKEKKRPKSANSKSKKSDKIIRAKSQKQVQTLDINKEKQRKIKLAQSIQSIQKGINNIQKKDIKKQLKKQIQKVQRQKSTHISNSLHLLYLNKPILKKTTANNSNKKQKKVLK